MRYQYFPGCSLKGTGRAYEESLLAVFRALDVELHEIDDWNCCGATAYMAVDENKALRLAARNLALAEKDKSASDIVVPCSGCYLVLNKTCHVIEENPELSSDIRQGLTSVGLQYQGTCRVRHPLDVLVNDIGLDAIKKRVTKPLKGLRVAPYYGCQIVRPYATFDHQVYPVTMDNLLKALGATVVDYSLKTRCCGASMTGTIPEVGQRLAYILLHEAQRRGADLMTTVCPLCQFNLDAYQDDISAKHGPVKMPVTYFTQMMGLAFGLDPKEVGLQRQIVSADEALAAASQRSQAAVGAVAAASR
jgi:heterodisulfide reductase subunit B